MRVLPHIKKLDDCFGQFLVRVVCGAEQVREIEPEALAPGWLVNDPEGARAADAMLALREGRRGCGGREARTARHPEESVQPMC
jgi:hypothetical protein